MRREDAGGGASLSDALRRTVRHEQVPLAAIDNPDMHAMGEFLTGRGYQVDIHALHAAYPELGWTSFAPGLTAP